MSLSLSRLWMTALFTLSLNGFAVAQPATPNFPFQFTELFTVNLSLGEIFNPIPIPGGILINEPITGGIVNGSAINGTVLGGLAHPSIYNNGTLEVPVIDAYGTTDDGYSFYIREEGIGSSSAQVTRIVSNVEMWTTSMKSSN